MVIYFYLLSIKCVHILLEIYSISYSDFNLLLYLSDLFRRLCRSTFCRACVFYMFLNMRLYHYSHFHLYLPKAFLFNCRKKQLAFKYVGFERT